MDFDVSKFVPCGSRMLVKRHSLEPQKGSLILPHRDVHAPICGKVVAYTASPDWPALVFFMPHAGIKMTFRDEEYILLKEEEIIGSCHGNA